MTFIVCFISDIKLSRNVISNNVVLSFETPNDVQSVAEHS